LITELIFGLLTKDDLDYNEISIGTKKKMHRSCCRFINKGGRQRRNCFGNELDAMPLAGTGFAITPRHTDVPDVTPKVTKLQVGKNSHKNFDQARWLEAGRHRPTLAPPEAMA
jgi:hypothetical protein